MLFKEYLSAFAIGLTFLAFVPYVKEIVAQKTQPHVFSWVIWGFTTIIVFFAQLKDGAGVGALPIGVSGLISLMIALLALMRVSDTSITKLDWLFFALAISALPLWFVTANPLWAVVILTTADVLGFGPTFRKVYARPFSESMLFFGLFALRNILVILALANYSITTVLFPAVIAIACILLVAMMAYRRTCSQTTFKN